ncbi:MAG: FAD-binding protein [Bosea sp. (in: a-proteobacteria)]
MPPLRTVYTSWGGLVAHGSEAKPARGWPRHAPYDRPVLAYGNGRSYGDSCLIDAGSIIDTAELSNIISFDTQTGLIIAEAGVLLSSILDLCVPQGWFLPVTPGTRFVTIGGAVANDVHGKNHHALGTFGCHVAWFDLVRSDGSVHRCSASANSALFAATIGGMGLTGLITRIALQLIPIKGPLMAQDTIPFANLGSFFDIAARSDISHDYTVAWIDSMAAGMQLGRGVFFRANHADEPGKVQAQRTIPFLPFTPPVSLLNRATLTAFNALYRAAQGKTLTSANVPYQPFFYPLDRISGWNRAYGPKGLRQFQTVVPMAVARDAIADMLKATHRAGEASFLTVLKLFGDKVSPGMMSFPQAGATLTLDFPYRGPRTDMLLAELDQITVNAKGRVNPYKDARMSPTMFEASFPQWREFAKHTDPAFTSNFWRRVTA